MLKDLDLLVLIYILDLNSCKHVIHTIDLHICLIWFMIAALGSRIWDLELRDWVEGLG